MRERGGKAERASACFIEPMLCRAVAKLPEGPAWQYEVKLDGYRAIGVRTKDGCRTLVAKQAGLLAPFSDCRARSGGAAGRDCSRWGNRRCKRRWAAVLQLASEFRRWRGGDSLLRFRCAGARRRGLAQQASGNASRDASRADFKVA